MKQVGCQKHNIHINFSKGSCNEFHIYLPEAVTLAGSAGYRVAEGTISQQLISYFQKTIK